MFEFSQDEHVILYIRRHWIFLVGEIVGSLFLFLFPFVFFILFQIYIGVPSFVIFGIDLFSLSALFIDIWAIFCWLFFVDRFTRYALNFWILTNKRLVESQFIQLFDRRISELELPDIEDITVEVNGFVQSMLGYGTLEVQTAGTKREFIASDILNPVGVEKQIFDARLALKRDEQDIEKGEFEQIAHRVVGEDRPINDSTNSQNSQNSDTSTHPDFHIPHDQKNYQADTTENISAEVENSTADSSTADSSVHNFDWAHVDSQQKQDLRNEVANLEGVDDKFKQSIEDALRSE